MSGNQDAGIKTNDGHTHADDLKHHASSTGGPSCQVVPISAPLSPDENQFRLSPFKEAAASKGRRP
jgi:hypothetical protein